MRFFHGLVSQLGEQVTLLKQECPALSWLTNDEAARRDEELSGRDEWGEDFDALAYCGHRYPDQLLPEPELERYMLWTLANKNVEAVLRLEQTMTILDVMEFYAYRRTDHYLDLEDKPKA